MTNSRETNNNRVLKNSVHASSQKIGITKIKMQQIEMHFPKNTNGENVDRARAHASPVSPHGPGAKTRLGARATSPNPYEQKKVDVQKIYTSLKYTNISINP